MPTRGVAFRLASELPPEAVFLLKDFQLAVNEAAGGLRFGPGALQHDVMMVLYDPGGGARPEPNATSRPRAVAPSQAATR